ncbi:MAG: response regulator, partial [Smithellaceae bacterium]|nr:response regulator [Smithellaceae bacterium]
MKRMGAKKILVIDDERDFLYAVEELLHIGGYEVLKAESGSSAFALLKEEVPQLILLDYKLPDQNGLE